MRALLAFLLIGLFVSPTFGVLISGVATGVTSTSASGTLTGIGWTATTSASSPFIGINMPAGDWDIPSFEPPRDGLFLGTGNVNAGESQLFTFDQPIVAICFFVENFDSSSAATVTTDGSLSLLAGSTSISFTSISSNSGELVSSNTSFDGEGDAILRIDGPITFIRFDYTDGLDDNGVFYGFGLDEPNVAAVPEPSSFLFLLLVGSGVTYMRRRRAD